MIIDLSGVSEMWITLDMERFPRHLVVVTADSSYDESWVKSGHASKTNVQPIMITHNAKPEGEFSARTFRAFVLQPDSIYEICSFREGHGIADYRRRIAKVQTYRQHLQLEIDRNEPVGKPNHKTKIKYTLEDGYPFITWELLGKGK